MNVADRCLELLYDRGESFYSLDELAAAAGLSLARLKAALKDLSARGHKMELAPAHGVRLVGPVRLDAHLIERGLGTRRLGRHVICFGKVDSTNDVALAAARQHGSDGLAVLADWQHKGRGRHGRRWFSRAGANVLLSVLLVDTSRSLAHDALTVAAGLAAAEGIQAACGADCRLKWPNDVVLAGAKVAGVLVEVRQVRRRRCVVVGIGVNVGAAPPQRKLDAPATSLAVHLGGPVERIEVVREVLRKLDYWVGQIAAVRAEAKDSDTAGYGALAALHDEWLSRCGIIGERLAVQCEGSRYVGRVLDVSPLEGLILRCDDGRTVHLPAEASTVLQTRP